MKFSWKYLKSFVAEDVVERSSSTHNDVLEVWLMFGKYTLNSQHVNLSYGQLDQVFREAFDKLRIFRRGYRDVLLLGLGAGNVVQILEEVGGDFRITGVEIDAEVIRLGKKYFGLDSYENLEIQCMDAVEYVATNTQRFDLIVVDLFIDARVPEGAEQEAFLKRAAAALRPGGMLIFNRLMLNDELKMETVTFTDFVKKVLPGSSYTRAHRNRMIYYEKP